MASHLNCFVLVLACMFASVAPAQTTWHVDDNAPGDPGVGDPLVSDPLEDGSASHPFDAIQEAIDASSAGDEVVVRDGTYTGLGNKNIDYGGRAITVRSENGAESCVIDCEGSGRGFYFHSDETNSSVLEGFTIQNGYTDSTTVGGCCGGAIKCGGSSPRIAFCNLLDNTMVSPPSQSEGGGAVSLGGAEAIIEDCRIQGNTASNGGGIFCTGTVGPVIIRRCEIVENTADHGGGVFSLWGGATFISDCVIADNTANGSGGGCHPSWQGSTIANSIIAGNTAGSGGGLMCSSDWYGCDHLIINCLIVNNSADTVGGGISCSGGWYEEGYAESLIAGCTFAGNTAGDGAGGVHCSGFPNTYHYVYLKSCIFWENTAPDWYAPGEWQGGVIYAGSTSSGVDPLFKDSIGPDGDPLTWADNDYHLRSDSPCIDAGACSSMPSDEYDIDGDGDTSERWPLDLDGLPRFVDVPEIPDTGWPDPPLYPEVMDQGCYEFQYTPPPPVIELTATEFGFGVPYDGSAPADQSLGIRNSGEGTLIWVVAEDCPWLGVNPTAGLCTTEVDYTVLSVNPAGLTPGVHETSLVVSAADGACEPRTVSVKLHIGPVHVPAEYATIGEAIDAVPSGLEIIVADGVHAGPGNRDLDCQGKMLWIHSLNGAANCVIDCEGAGRGFTLASGEDATTIIEGFTIRNGFAEQDGGAFYCEDSSPTIRNCVIEDCEAGDDGGGIYCLRSAPAILECTIADNSAGDDGGGIFCEIASHPVLVSCRLAGNSVPSAGGAVCCASSDLTMTGCLVAGNTARYGSAASCGGGNLSLRDTTVMGNEAVSDGGISCVTGGRLLARSSILWGNSPQEIVRYSGSAAPGILYSDVAGGWTGEGNIDANPLFVDPDGPDNDHATWEDNVYRLSEGSPCIDAGSNLEVPLDEWDLDADGDVGERIPFDLSGFARFVDDPDMSDTGLADPPAYPAVVDIGAYEFQALPNDCNDNGIPDDEDIASGYSKDCDENGTPDECELCGDLNDDESVDYDDYMIFLAAFGGVVDGAPPEDACCDADDSGDIGMADYAAWLACYRDFIQDPLADPPAAPGDEGFSGRKKGDTQPDRKAHRPRPRAAEVTEAGAGATPHADRAASRRR